MPRKGDWKCRGCDVFLDEGTDKYWPDGGALSPKSGPICDLCYSEDETIVSVQIFYPDRTRETLDLGDYQAQVKTVDEDGSCDYDTIEQPTGWTAEWNRTDAWRGYYDISAPDGWVNVKSDAIFDLTAHELEAFDRKLRQRCEKAGVACARVTSRTSKVFSTGGDWYVQAAEETGQLIRLLQAALVDGFDATSFDAV